MKKSEESEVWLVGDETAGGVPDLPCTRVESRMSSKYQMMPRTVDRRYSTITGREACIIRVELLGALEGFWLVLAVLLSVGAGALVDFMDSAVSWDSQNLTLVATENRTLSTWDGVWEGEVTGIDGTYLTAAVTQWKYDGEYAPVQSFSLRFDSTWYLTGLPVRHDGTSVSLRCGSSEYVMTRSLCATVTIPSLGRGVRMDPGSERFVVRATAAGIPVDLAQDKVKVHVQVREVWFDALQCAGRWLIIIGSLVRYWRFRRRCLLAPAPLRLEHSVVKHLILILVVGANPLFFLGFLKRSSNAALNIVVDTVLFHVPYLTPWTVQGAAWGGVFGLLQGPFPAAVRCFGWVLFSAASDIAFSVLAKDASVTVDEAYARALFRGASVDTVGFATDDLGSNLLVAAMVYTIVKLVWVGNLLGLLFLPSECPWGPRSQLRNLSYTQTRDRQIGMRFLQIVTMGLIAQIMVSMVFSTAGPYLGYGSAGGILCQTVLVMLIAFAYSPVWLLSDDELPPAPYTDLWMQVRWTRPWLKWANHQSGVKSLYIFPTESQRRHFEMLNRTGSMCSYESSDSDLSFASGAVKTNSNPHVDEFIDTVFCIEDAVRSCSLSLESYYYGELNVPTTGVTAALVLICAFVSEEVQARDSPMSASMLAAAAAASPRAPVATPRVHAGREELRTIRPGPAFRLLRVISGRSMQVLILRDTSRQRPGYRPPIPCAGEPGQPADSAPPEPGWGIAIAFRGTCNARNVGDDFDAIRVLWGYGDSRVSEVLEPETEAAPVGGRCLCCGPVAVHRGFAKIWENVGDTVMSYVLRVLRDREPVRCTGHSLGGALACLCAYELQRQVRNPVSIMTFGSPKVGNSAFARALDRLVPAHFRCVNKDDRVTRSALVCGNAHAGREVLLCEKGALLVPSPPWIERWLQPAREACSCGVLAHQLSDYLAALVAAASVRGYNLQCHVADDALPVRATTPPARSVSDVV